jgi:hypothetical protein
MSTATTVLNEHEGLLLKDDSKAKEISKRFGLPVKEEPKEEAEELIACPERSAMVAISLCSECEKREGCPAHE